MLQNLFIDSFVISSTYIRVAFFLLFVYFSIVLSDTSSVFSYFYPQ